MSGAVEAYKGAGYMMYWTTWILGTKMVTTNLMLGYYRAKAGQRLDEDEGVMPYSMVTKGDATRTVERFKGIVQNDLENIPIGLVIMGNAAGIPFGYDLDAANMHAGFWWFGAVCFLVGRFFHSIFFAQEMQPFRTISFAVGFFGTFLHLIMSFIYITSVSFRERN